MSIKWKTFDIRELLIKVLGAALKVFAVVFISVLIAHLIINIWDNFNIEIIQLGDGYHLYRGQPLLNKISGSNIVDPLILLSVILAASYFLLSERTKFSKTIISIAILILSVLVTFPGLVTIGSARNPCYRLESLSNNMVGGTINYFIRNPTSQKVPSALEVIEKIPPGYSVSIYGDAAALIEITVEDVIKGRCSHSIVIRKIDLSKAVVHKN